MNAAKSQVEILLDYLKEHRSITGMECIAELGIMNYKGRISDLRSLGYPIKTVFETGEKKRGKKRPTFARYILESEVPVT